MKQFFLFLLVLFFSNSNIALSDNIIKSIGIEANFATMKLIGNTMATKMQIFQITGSGQIHSGGGLKFIQPGIELSTILYLDKQNLHRAVVGTELMSLISRERIPFAIGTWLFAKHEVILLDFYTGWHYAFWDMDWQDAKLYAGPELMFNFMLKNHFNGGTNYDNPEIEEQIITTDKDAEFRLGTRLRVGVEGRLHGNLYFNGNFSIGAYNLLLRNDATGELFNMKNDFEKKELIQGFYNINIGFRYKL